MLIITAIGLLLVLEGALYALFPNAMQRMMLQMIAMPSDHLRRGGLALALCGFVIIYLVSR